MATQQYKVIVPRDSNISIQDVDGTFKYQNETVTLDDEHTNIGALITARLIEAKKADKPPKDEG